MSDAVTGADGRALADGVLRRAPVGFLAVHDEAGPYVVPISFAYDGLAVYFHGGEGRKADALAGDPRACLTATSEPAFIRGAGPCDDNFRYESAVASGTVELLRDAAAKETALRALVVKYDPAAGEAAFDPGTLERTLVYRLDVAEVSYKRNPGT